MVQNYVAYLKDDTRLITNPGLKVTTHFGYLYFTGFVSLSITVWYALFLRIFFYRTFACSVSRLGQIFLLLS